MSGDEQRRIPRYLRVRPAGYQENPLTAVVTDVPREQLEQDLLGEQDRVLELTGEVSRLRAEVAR
ncbi:MAG: hypothetical protein H7233_04670, partial [Pseudorhodobacter sp.]|nr:hypothetical protein [Frankiaceae bacterium]